MEILVYPLLPESFPYAHPSHSPISANLTVRGPRKPAWAGVIMWPTAKAVGK